MEPGDLTANQPDLLRCAMLASQSSLDPGQQCAVCCASKNRPGGLFHQRDDGVTLAVADRMRNGESVVVERIQPDQLGPNVCRGGLGCVDAKNKSCSVAERYAINCVRARVQEIEMDLADLVRRQCGPRQLP